MRVPVDVDALARTVQRHWIQQVQAASQSAARLSTGTALSTAMDDAAGVAISARHRSGAAGLAQAGRNAQDAMAAARVSQGGLSEMTAMLQRMRVLSVQAANGTFADSQRAAMQAAVVMTLDEMDALVRRTEAGGAALLGGGSMTVQAGAGPADLTRMSLADARRDNLGLGEGAGLDISTQDGARSALEMLDEALQRLFEEQAKSAAMENRMAAAARALAVQEANQEAALARTQGTDMAKEAAALAKAQMLTRSGSQMMQHVLEVQRSVLDLLRFVEPAESLDPAEPVDQAVGRDQAGQGHPTGPPRGQAHVAHAVASPVTVSMLVPAFAPRPAADARIADHAVGVVPADLSVPATPEGLGSDPVPAG